MNRHNVSIGVLSVAWILYAVTFMMFTEFSLYVVVAAVLGFLALGAVIDWSERTIVEKLLIGTTVLYAVLQIPSEVIVAQTGMVFNILVVVAIVGTVVAYVAPILSIIVLYELYREYDNRQSVQPQSESV